MKRIFLYAALLAAAPLQMIAQSLTDDMSQAALSWSIGADGIFDRHQYSGDFLKQTISGIRITPEVILEISKNDRLAAGLSWVDEFGSSNNLKPDFTLYYGHNVGCSGFVFGAFPRSILQRQLPSAMLYDSITFFNPVIQGAMYQYSKDYFETEAYVNWLGRKAKNERESFRLVSDGYWDADLLGYFDLGWYAAYNYYGTPSNSEGWYKYQKLMLNPYIETDFEEFCFLTDIRAELGLLTNTINYEKLGHWVNPMGLNIKLDADWRLVHIGTELYCGDKLLPYMQHSGTGTDFHSSDPFYNSFVYSKNKVSLLLFKNAYAESNVEYLLHYTAGSPLNHQLLFKIHVYVEGKK